MLGMVCLCRASDIFLYLEFSNLVLREETFNKVIQKIFWKEENIHTFSVHRDVCTAGNAGTIGSLQ